MVGPAALRPAVVELEAKFALKTGRLVASSALYYLSKWPERADIRARLRILAAPHHPRPILPG